MADAPFRAVLKDHGCRYVQDVVVALDDTPVVEVLDRVFTRARPPALVAVRRPREDLGFVFLVVKAVVGPSKEPSSVGGQHFRYGFEPVDPELLEA